MGNAQIKIMINLIFTLFILLHSLSCGKRDGENPARPNILFIMSDDHAYQAISAYNDRLIRTPNIDRIAEEGALFTNSCVTNSICAPSRAGPAGAEHAINLPL